MIECGPRPFLCVDHAHELVKQIKVPGNGKTSIGVRGHHVEFLTLTTSLDDAGKLHSTAYFFQNIVTLKKSAKVVEL